MPHFPEEIEYSEKQNDDHWEQRHVLLPKNVQKKIPRGRLLVEREWRALGVQQSRGWVHQEIHRPEPYILLFRRPVGTEPQTGLPPDTHPFKDEHLMQLKAQHTDEFLIRNVTKK